MHRNATQHTATQRNATNRNALSPHFPNRSSGGPISDLTARSLNSLHWKRKIRAVGFFRCQLPLLEPTGNNPSDSPDSPKDSLYNQFKQIRYTGLRLRQPRRKHSPALVSTLASRLSALRSLLALRPFVADVALDDDEDPSSPRSHCSSSSTISTSCSPAKSLAVCVPGALPAQPDHRLGVRQLLLDPVAEDRGQGRPPKSSEISSGLLSWSQYKYRARTTTCSS